MCGSLNQLMIVMQTTHLHGHCPVFGVELQGCVFGKSADWLFPPNVREQQGQKEIFSKARWISLDYSLI